MAVFVRDGEALRSGVADGVLLVVARKALLDGLAVRERERVGVLELGRRDGVVLGRRDGVAALPVRRRLLSRPEGSTVAVGG